MTPEVAVDMFRSALWLTTVMVAVLVVPSLLVGLLVAMFQAATQINEQTLSFLPRLLVMLVTSGLTHLPPMKVVTILSGVVSFDLKWFIVSAIVARGGRFYLLAYLLKTHGAKMAVFIERRMAWIVAGVLVLLALVWLIMKAMG